MSYQVIVYKNNKENIIYETDDFIESFCVAKTYAKKHNMIASKEIKDNVLVLYIRKTRCKIKEAIGVIEKCWREPNGKAADLFFI